MSADVLILGGGVIGLSLAYELAQRGQRVRVLERGAIAREASWAGAGILPPANRRTARDGLEQLAGLSHELHPQWAERLRAETGIDTGFRRTGGIYLACEEAEEAPLAKAVAEWQRQEIAAAPLTPERLAELEPALADGAALRLKSAWLLPAECQLRNPWHTRALATAVQQWGVELCPSCPVRGISVAGGRITSVTTTAGEESAGAYVLAAGAWSAELACLLGIELALRPIRGQIALLAASGIGPVRVINQGLRYLVPRDDGHILVGSTEEDVGFQKENTSAGIAGLLGLAYALAPGLQGAALERTWAGLRPGTSDGRPYLGALPGLSNGFVAAGHFRAGLHLSPGTAVTLAQLMLGETPAVDLFGFRVGR